MASAARLGLMLALMLTSLLGGGLLGAVLTGSRMRALCDCGARGAATPGGAAHKAAEAELTRIEAAIEEAQTRVAEARAAAAEVPRVEAAVLAAQPAAETPAPLAAPSRVRRRVVVSVENAIQEELQVQKVAVALVDCKALQPYVPALPGLVATCLTPESQSKAAGKRVALVYAVPRGPGPYAAGALLRRFSGGLPSGATLAVQLRYESDDQGNSAALTAAFITNAAGMHLLLYQSSNVYQHTFQSIYTSGMWGAGDAGGGGSGSGSSMASTAVLRERLAPLLKKYSVGSMLDSSCGSMHWMRHVLESLGPGFRFLGLDVACSLVQRHNATLASAHSNWSFQCLDYSHEPLPTGFDLIFSRDSLQHLPYHAAFQFLNQVRNSGARLLLVSSYVNRTGLRENDGNQDISPGQYYNIDLTSPPFNVRPAPLEIINERTDDKKHMLLYDVPSMTWDDPLWDI